MIYLLKGFPKYGKPFLFTIDLNNSHIHLHIDFTLFMA